MLSHGIELWEYYIITHDRTTKPTDTAGYPPSKPLKSGVPTYNPHFVRPDRGPRHKTRGGNDNEFLTFAVRHVRREYMYTKWSTFVVREPQLVHRALRPRGTTNDVVRITQCSYSHSVSTSMMMTRESGKDSASVNNKLAVPRSLRTRKSAHGLYFAVSLPCAVCA